MENNLLIFVYVKYFTGDRHVCVYVCDREKSVYIHTHTHIHTYIHTYIQTGAQTSSITNQRVIPIRKPASNSMFPTQ